MCGITGIFAFNEVGRFNMVNLAKATGVISSRGPDNQGLFNDYFVGLGHRRLSIIDTSSDGTQPMSDATGRYTIVFNGEIYNFQELRQQLEKQGVSFNSKTDTEVLLNLFIKEKEQCLERLNGFFVFSVYDKKEKTMFIARDRMGIKPLLYFLDDDKFIFASEMKALLAYGIQKEIDFTSLSQYLQFNYIPAPHSMLKGVKKLMPGHYMKIKGRDIQIEQYYKIPYDKEQPNPQNISYDKQKDKLVELLDESVQKRLISDVPLGTFLSGGIDSSVITALASKHVDKLNTFSIGYQDEKFFDETKYANIVAKKFNTNHTVFSLSNRDLYEHLYDVLDYFDEPFADSSAIAVYILSKETRKNVTVALSGDGADEMFSGYNKHAAALKAINGGRSASLVKQLLPLWKMLPKSRNSTLGNKVRQLQRFAEGMQLTDQERYWKWASLASNHQAEAILSATSRNLVEEEAFKSRKQQILKHIKGTSNISDLLYTDMQLVLTNDMLTKVDMMSMANSLEVRVPFLDHHLVAFAFQLPDNSKINKQMKKRILQDAFRDVLPKELYKRPKHGFEVPLLKWFRGDLKSLIENDLLEERFIAAQGIFNYNGIKKLKQQLFSSNPEDVHARIWGLIVFQWWWKKYFV